MTGIRPPDLSHLEPILLRDFVVLVRAFDGRSENTEQKNFLDSYTLSSTSCSVKTVTPARGSTFPGSDLRVVVRLRIGSVWRCS